MSTNDTHADNDFACAQTRIDRIETYEYLDSAPSDTHRLKLALANDAVQENPHRDPERLREAYDTHGTVTDVAQELDCSKSAASKWLATYGIRPKTDEGSLPPFVRAAIEAEQSTGGSA
jgi:hypothetical protein